MVDEEPDVEAVRRRHARSGRVDYGDPVILHDSSRTRVVVVPFFIPHTDHTELAIKLITYMKAASPDEWLLVEERCLSLGEAASRRLLMALKTHLKVAESGESGDFLLIRVAEGIAQIGTHDPARVAAALTKVLSQDEILEHLRGTELSTELVSAFRGAIRLNEMRSAVARLRQLLDADESTEDVYQEWCETHSWAFGNAYVMRDEVRDISTGDRLDILLPTVIAGYRDIVELKRPDMPVLFYDEARRSFYFSADVSKAMGQCHRYLDVLHEAAAEGLLDHPEIVAYHPRAIIVIGRSQGWPVDKLRALHGLNRRLSGISVMTYDHLLAQGERLIDMLNPKPKELPEIEAFFERDNDGDEDVPF
jgi:sirohydrochlorin ferrochelatase